MAQNESLQHAHFGAAGILKNGMKHSERLFHHTYASLTEDMQFLEFRLLQRLNLVQLQNELARHKASVWKDMEASESELKAIRRTLSDYGEFLKALSRWTKCWCTQLYTG